MTREDILAEILSLKGSNWLLEMATSLGKSRLALEKVKSLSNTGQTLLIVVNRTVHKNNWLEEIDKWWKGCQLNIKIVTYKSFPTQSGEYDFAIFDECHHLSERCIEALNNYKIGNSILLSATVGKQLKSTLSFKFKELVIKSIDLRDAIDNDILAEPIVYLLPLELDTVNKTEVIVKNPKAKGATIRCTYENRWNFIKQKSSPVIISCTPRQYLTDLNKQIEFWKTRYMNTKNQIAKNKWLRLCGDRLKWLSDKKVPIVLEILSKLKDKRTLTFCNSIEQTEIYGSYCINSKNKDSVRFLDMFNEGKCDHITACNMLNEGMNLRNCQCGIYANLNSSETIIKQRLGRILRHKNPIIIIPFYANSREEELVKEMMKDYNAESVKTTTLTELKL